MGEGNRVQIETDSLHHAGIPGQISQQQGTKVDADLSVAQQEALLGWPNDVACSPGCPRRSRSTSRPCSRWRTGWSRDVLDVDANSDYGAAFAASTRTSARR